MNEPLDQQPASTEPIAGTSSGIDGVAQFIPSDAKLNHSTPPPSQPLATDAADINPDAAMTDAPASAPNDIPVPADSSSSVSVANATASDKAAATDTLAPPPGEDVKDLPDQTAQPTSVTSAPDAEATAASAPVPDADQTMQDALASGTVRQREDDETTGEPAAKRAKTGEATNDQVLEFKQPDAPTTAPVASPATNGDSTANRPSRSFSKSPITTTQKNALMEKLKNTKKVKSAFWFLRPVDYVALNIPHYPDIIKHPMDLSTIEKKLKNDDYTCMDDLVADFELMVENCQKFNGPAHNVTASALSMRAYFMKQMESIPTGNAAAHPPKGVATKKQPPPAPKQSAARRQSKPGAGVTHSAATGDTYALQPNGTPLIRRDSTADRPKRAVVPPASRDLPYAAAKPKRKDAAAGLKFCEHMMEELKKKPKYKKLTEPFLVPVDPVALQIPHYFSIIKHPMDLQTMGQKLKGGQYASDREFKADFDLMIENCKKFNGPQNPIYAFAVDLQSEFDKDWVKKDAWVKKFERPPVSRPISEASSDESDAEEDEEEHDANDAQIQMLQQQISALQNTLQTMSQSKRSSPKAGGKKKSKGNGKTKKASTLPTPAPRAAPKPKAKKQRQVTYEEKQEISSATEKMSESQVQKLTQIIAENVPKYNVSRLLSVDIVLPN